MSIKHPEASPEVTNFERLLRIPDKTEGSMATGVPMADTDYLKRMVGDTLAKGCAATMAANPTDPVEYLGQWLLQ